MDYFRLSIPGLDHTLTELDTTIRNMEELKSKVETERAQLITDGWSGAGALQFSRNTETWSRQFSRYIEALQTMRDILKNTVLPAAVNQNMKALGFAGIFNGSAGIGVKNQLSLICGPKEEACHTVGILKNDYDVYSDILQSIRNLDCSLRSTSFSIGPELNESLNGAETNRNLLNTFLMQFNDYHDDLQTLENTAVNLFEGIREPEEWTVMDELASIMMTHLPRPVHNSEGAGNVQKVKSTYELYLEMVRIDEQAHALSYNWDLITSLMQSDPDTWGNQSLYNYQALAMVFESMTKAEDIEQFINSGYRIVFASDSKEDEAKRRELMQSNGMMSTFLDSYYFINKTYIPASSPVLIGLKNYYGNKCKDLPAVMIRDRSDDLKTYNRARIEMGKMVLLTNICKYGDYLEVSTSTRSIPQIQINNIGLVDGDYSIQIPAGYSGVSKKNISVYTFGNGSDLDSLIHDISKTALDSMSYGTSDYIFDTSLTVLGITATAPVSIPASLLSYGLGTEGSIEISRTASVIKDNLTLADYAKALEINMAVSDIDGNRLVVNQACLDGEALEKKLEYYNSEEFDISRFNEPLSTALEIPLAEISKMNLGNKGFAVNDIIDGLDGKDDYSAYRLKLLINIIKENSL